MRRNRGTGKGLAFIRLIITQKTDICIDWPFYRMKNGYGMVGDHEKMHLAHRFVCVEVHGPAPFAGAQAAHYCGNKACVNPKHIRWASQAENEDDKHTHGTWGARRGGAKINFEIARAIRADLAEGLTHRKVAEKHGITKSIVSKVACGRTWQELV